MHRRRVLPCLAAIGAVVLPVSCPAPRSVDVVPHAAALPTESAQRSTSDAASTSSSSAPHASKDAGGVGPCHGCEDGAPPAIAGQICCHIWGNGWSAHSCQTKAICEAAQLKAKSETEKSRCASPGDCPKQQACVVGGLGGAVGCTGEHCCGAAECTNGCRSDADCPSCRPVCRKAPKGVTGSCGSSAGP